MSKAPSGPTNNKGIMKWWTSSKWPTRILPGQECKEYQKAQKKAGLALENGRWVEKA